MKAYEDSPDHGSDPFMGHVQKRPQRTQLAELAIPVLLPWLMFFLVLCLFLFTYRDMQVTVWVSIGCCFALSLLFLCMGWSNRSGHHFATGLLCFVSVVAGMVVGVWLHREYLTKYWEIDTGVQYSNVNPMLDGRRTRDAGVISFTPDSFVDDKRTVGFVTKGTIFCVAPVVRPPHKLNILEYWAIGEDCCEQRAHFDCGLAREADSSTSIVQNPPQREYLRAVQQAASVHGVNASAHPQLVSFLGDPKVVVNDIWDEALTLSLVALIVHLCVCTVTSLVLARAMTASPQQLPLLPKY